jgi:hypothetical protein
VPLFVRRIALATDFPAAFPYLRLLDFFFDGMKFLPRFRVASRAWGCVCNVA